MQVFIPCAPPYASHREVLLGALCSHSLGILYMPRLVYLEEEYKVSYTTILRADKDVLNKDMPKPKQSNVEGILINEKYLGPSKGFVTMVMDAKTAEPLELVAGRDGKCLDAFFNRFQDEEKQKMALRQIHFLMLQKVTKMPMSYYQQI